MALYISSFHHPNDWEKDAARRTIDEATAHLTTLQRKKAALQFELLKLTCEENCFIAEVRANRSLLSNARRIPFEVLSEIFLFYVHANPTHIARLMLVCHAWNYVIINQRRLWTTITLRGPFTDSYVERQKSFIRTCMKRSEPLPVDIDMESTGHASASAASSATCEMPDGTPLAGHKMKHSTRDCLTCRSESRNVIKLCDELVGVCGVQVDRWRSVRLVWPVAYGLMDKNVDQIFSHSARNLEQLVILGPSSNSRLKFIIPPNANRLRTVETHSVCWNKESISPTPSLEELTIRLDEYDRYFTQMNEVGLGCLTNFRNLKSLSLATEFRFHRGVPSNVVTSMAPIVLPCLRTLSLRGNVHPQALACLDLPALHELHIAENRAFKSSLPNLSSLTFNNPTALKVLTLTALKNHTGDNMDHIVGALKTHTAIEELHLQEECRNNLLHRLPPHKDPSQARKLVLIVAGSHRITLSVSPQLQYEAPPAQDIPPASLAVPVTPIALLNPNLIHSLAIPSSVQHYYQYPVQSASTITFPQVVNNPSQG